MELQKTTQSPSGGKVKTLDEFKELCQSEYLVKRDALVAEFKEREQHIVSIRERKVREYSFINLIIALNTDFQKGKVNTPAMIEAEQAINTLSFDNVIDSSPLDYWRKEFGESMIVPVICDIMNYFLRQFTVKETISHVQIVQLSIKLLSLQPLLRIKELVFVLNGALQGRFGDREGIAHYQHIGLDTVLGWLTRFYEESAIHLEAKTVNNKPESANNEPIWEAEDKMLRKYEREQRAKKEISEKVWNIQKRIEVNQQRLKEQQP